MKLQYDEWETQLNFNLLRTVLSHKNFMSASMTFIAVTRLTLDCNTHERLLYSLKSTWPSYMDHVYGLYRCHFAIIISRRGLALYRQRRSLRFGRFPSFCRRHATKSSEAVHMMCICFLYTFSSQIDYMFKSIDAASNIMVLVVSVKTFGHLCFEEQCLTVCQVSSKWIRKLSWVVLRRDMTTRQAQKTSKQFHKEVLKDRPNC